MNKKDKPAVEFPPPLKKIFRYYPAVFSLEKKTFYVRLIPRKNTRHQLSSMWSRMGIGEKAEEKPEEDKNGSNNERTS